MQGSRKAFILVLLYVLGLSISSSRHVEDPREYEDEEAEEEEIEDVRDSEDEEDPANEEDQDDGYNQDSRGRAEDEEEVNIPGRSVDDNEEAEEDEDDDEGYSEDEEDEGKNSEDHRMMDGDEGGMPLPDDDDVEVYSPEQTGMEDFERRVKELHKVNENMQMTIDEMERKIDEALSSNNENGPGSSDTSVDRKIVVEGDESYKDRYSTINKDEEDTPRHLQQADAPQETSRGDAVARQYSEIGEDTNAVPDEDY